jgi:hypothetical protein
MKPPPYIRGLIDLFSTGKRTGVALGILGLAIILISATTSIVSHANNPYYNGLLITGSIWLYIGFIIFFLAFLVILGDARYSAMQRREREVEGQQRLRSAEDELAKSLKPATGAMEDGKSVAPSQHAAEDKLALSVLWEVTNARLSQYHQIATGQARKSFLMAQTSIAIGFMLLIGFAVLSFRTHSATASITTAALGAVAAALAGYISRTFIRSQETSAKHLRAYFDQPLEFSRYLAAERLLSSQPDTKTEERDELLRIIIAAMVEGSETGNIWESDTWGDNSLRLRRDLFKTRKNSKEPLSGPSRSPTRY